MAHWLCETRCKDGTDISYTRPYCEDGVYMAEENRIYNLECELIDRAEKHGGVDENYGFCVYFERDDDDEEVDER